MSAQAAGSGTKKVTDSAELAAPGRSVVRVLFRRLRGILFADPAIVLATIFYGSISLTISFFDRKRNGFAQHGVARAWARMLLRVSGVRVQVEGLEQIEAGRSYVFISNHLSYMDTPVVLAHVPVQFRFLAKRGLFQIPLLGTHLHRAGHIRVPREDPRGAVKTMQMAAETIQKQGISLLVFPEGGRSHDGMLRPFKEGGAYIAIRAGVPVVPLALLGTRQILPYGGGVVESGSVVLRILKPIDTAAMSLKDRGSLTEAVRALIANELRESEETPLASTATGLR
ncbi:MAG TPA: lysophospholipid acyltransferase family protein [Bryobacteraceae bacterium]|jgi:1-acyl-sn-glycerol-3-phosphate acyltransferase|nr:lysophospholipid acyltransferase family protein [Bryobacteraceae bacterium]